MFLSGKKKNDIYPCKPQFYYIKVGFAGVKIISACFRDGFEEIATPSFFVPLCLNSLFPKAILTYFLYYNSC